MQGFNVLHPMGFDSFGLPTEQYAIKTGKSPVLLSDQLVKRYKEQLSILGFSYDWNRQVATHDPEYYRWTQWIFLQIYNSWYDKKNNKARPIDELVKIFETSGNAKINAVSSNDGAEFTAKEWKAFSDLEKQNTLMNYRLAYEGNAEVNWCESMGTVLANDEVIEVNGKMVSERGEFPVEKKSMRQWFMRITAYADRLIEGLETIDWSNSVKEIQRNWIGKSEGSEIEFELLSHHGYSIGDISVFTTRADTLFGVTYVVLAPELELIQNLKHEITNWDDVQQYITTVKSKSDEDRVAAKEKTGIQLEGIFAINPANNEQVPVWIADYVLAGYGTGAVMAVPAHDERDFEFAQKYDLPMKCVVAFPVPEIPSSDAIRRDGAISIITNKNDEVLVLTTTEGGYLFPQGGIEKGENPAEAAQREVIEESGYCDIKIIQNFGVFENYFYDSPEFIRHRFSFCFFGKLNSTKQVLQNSDEGDEKYIPIWMKVNDAIEKLNHRNHSEILKVFVTKIINTGPGNLVNSGKFNGMTSEQARKAITEFVGGKLVTKYKMRDAIFARQRYWGEPIPLVHDKDGTIKTVPEKQLPLTLPKVKSYEPSGNGEGPLATVSAWVKAGYETNTMPGWAGSSWYFLRYTDPTNKKAFASKEELDYWFPAPRKASQDKRKNGGVPALSSLGGGVNMYVGGAEHATGHLLYSRFWHKVLKDLGHVGTEEPFQTLRNQGMIGGADGRKMSKRWGNVINPDDVVHDMGADTMRVYESFMGPFEAHLPWSIDGIAGARRFIERIWRFQTKVSDTTKTSDQLQKVLHKTIKKVTEDIHNFAFNTAVSAMMIFANELEKSESINTKDWMKFLQILAPFAPHITDELWASLGEKKSIHIAPWPQFDLKKVIDDTVTIGIQINGKVRGEIQIALNESEESIKTTVLSMSEIVKWIDGNDIKKFIYIKGKVVNIVI
jgi:leucyl-tRNA synthetase